VFVANRRRIEVANIPVRQCRVNFCSTGSKHFCSIEEVVPWMNPLNEWSRPPFRPRTRRKEDSPSLDNNGSSSFSLVIRSTFDGHEDGQPFFDLERLHGEAFFYQVSIRYHLLEILTLPKHQRYSINISKHMIFILPLLWISKLAW